LRVGRHIAFDSQSSFSEGATDMKNDTELTEAGRQYTAAYATHYTQRDLPAALRLYMNLMESHPSTPEASDSWSQVQNIVTAVVPREELLGAQIELAHAHLGDES
jgi:hypothetical protein